MMETNVYTVESCWYELSTLDEATGLQSLQIAPMARCKIMVLLVQQARASSFNDDPLLAQTGTELSV